MNKVFIAFIVVLVIAISAGCKSTSKSSSTQLFHANPDMTWAAVQNTYRDITGRNPLSVDDKNRKIETGPLEICLKVDQGDKTSQRISQVYSGVIYVRPFVNGSQTESMVTIDAVTKPQRMIKTSDTNNKNESTYSNTITNGADSDLCKQFMTTVGFELAKLQNQAVFEKNKQPNKEFINQGDRLGE